MSADMELLHRIKAKAATHSRFYENTTFSLEHGGVFVKFAFPKTKYTEPSVSDIKIITEDFADVGACWCYTTEKGGIQAFATQAELEAYFGSPEQPKEGTTKTRTRTQKKRYTARRVKDSFFYSLVQDPSVLVARFTPAGFYTVSITRTMRCMSTPLYSVHSKTSLASSVVGQAGKHTVSAINSRKALQARV